MCKTNELILIIIHKCATQTNILRPEMAEYGKTLLIIKLIALGQLAAAVKHVRAGADQVKKDSQHQVIK